MTGSIRVPFTRGPSRRIVSLVNSAAAAPFTPTSIAGLRGWWDASDAATFTFSSGAIVSQWNDKSGNSNHLTQGTVGFQPSRSGTQNGLSTVIFDGVDDRMVCAGLDALLTGDLDFTIVAAFLRPTTVNGSLLGTQTTSATKGILVFHPSGSTMTSRVDNATTTANRTWTAMTGTFRIIASTFDASGTPFLPLQHSQGVENVAAESTAGAMVTASGPFAVGARDSGGTLPGDIQLGELLIYDSILSGANVTALETYLNLPKWAAF